MPLNHNVVTLVGGLLAVGIILVCEASPLLSKCPQIADVNSIFPDVMYADPDDCKKFYHCENGDPVAMTCDPGTVFSDEMKVCVHAGSEEDTCTPQHPVRECKRRSVDFIPFPGFCQLYYNCSDSGPRNIMFDEYMSECPYPQVFDIQKKRCVHYEGAVCGEGREIPKWICQYLANQCPVAHCRPCYVDNPSCIDKKDGEYPDPIRMWSPMYIECKSERLFKSERCPVHELTNTVQLYNPDKLICAPLWEIPRVQGGNAPSCEGKEPGPYKVEGIEVIAYSCPDMNFFLCGAPEHHISLCTPI